MEYSEMIIPDGPAFNQQSYIYVNEAGNVLFNEDGHNYQDQTQAVSGEQTFDFVQIQPQERIIYIDQNGCLLEGFQDVGPLIFQQQELPPDDDGEIPSQLLDHNYAKKPREPGSEQTAKPRRRSKRRDQVVEQFQAPQPQPQTPKINIIRQRLPASLYKSLSPSRPKILQGNSTASRRSQSPVSTVTSTVSPKTSGKININGGASGRNIKKEDPLSQPGMYVTLEDDGRPSQAKSTAIGNGSKSLKEPYFLNKSFKPFISKTTPNPVILDDLQSRSVGATGYEEEMLFDFGISGDEDEVNCTLSSEAFSDVVFDECEFTAGLEVYAAPVLSQNNVKASSPSRSPVVTTLSLGQRCLKRNLLSTSATLSSGMSDDDDSNQIMVSMSGRRKSRESSNEWETEKAENKDIIDTVGHECSEVVMHPPFQIDNDNSSEVAETESDKSTTAIISQTQDPPEAEELVNSSVELTPCSQIKDEPFEQKYEPPTTVTISLENPVGKRSSRKRTTSQEPLLVNDVTSPISKTSPTFVIKSPVEPTRRSNRAIKAPAWLDEKGDSPVTKKKRR